MKDERKDSVLGRTEMLQKREEMRSKGRVREAQEETDMLIIQHSGCLTSFSSLAGGFCRKQQRGA